MKVAIAYYSEHHGNTKKLLDAIKEVGDVTLFNVVEIKEADLNDYDVIGLASGTYYGTYSKELMEFAKINLPNSKRVFLMSTYGSVPPRKKEMYKILEGKSCQLLGTYGCKGYDTYGPFKLFGGIAKGHPMERDIKGAVEFFSKMV